MAWTFPFSAEELQVFLQEADEQLQTLEEGLLELERRGASADLLAAIFRAAHTLKGSAGAVGHEAMARLTHALEGLLDGLRAGRLRVTAELADALLDAVDRLGRIRLEIGEGRSGEVDVETAVRFLESLAGAAGANGLTVGTVDRRTHQGASNGVAAAGRDAPQGATTPLTGDVARGPRVAAAVLLDPECQLPAIRAYQAVLAAQECGVLLESLPSLTDIEQERVGDRVELRVEGCAPDVLERALRAVPDVREVRVVVAVDPVQAAPVVRQQRTVRVDVSVLDNLMDLVGELVIDRTRLAQAVGRIEDAGGEEGQRELAQLSAHLWRITADLQDEVMRSRMLPVESLFRKFPRLVRDAARQLGKEIAFVVVGQETELDRSVLEEIGDPLVHVLRNAVDHGIEAPEVRRSLGKPAEGTVTLTAEHRENRIFISVRDDGSGIDPDRLRAVAVERGVLSEEAAHRLSRDEALQLIFAPGFTTKTEATALSGRGVGMDVVRKNIERLNGSVQVSTEAGRGTCLTISLPLTLAIVRALLVAIEETVFALPLHTVIETLRLDAAHLATIRGAEVVRVRGQVLPLMQGRRLLGSGAAVERLGGPLVHLSVGDRSVALSVDSLLGEQEVVIKALDRRLGAPAGIAGATILGDGRVALILDPVSLLKGMAANDLHGGGQVA